MTHEQKVIWMRRWADENKVTLTLDGQVGLGKPCVGIVANGQFIQYHWYDNWGDQKDHNGEVWTPVDFYDKVSCVCVEGIGENAEEQLYDWLKWFDDYGFTLKHGTLPFDERNDLDRILGVTQYQRMVKTQKEDSC